MKDPLFEPIMINNLEIKNRIYMPAMHMNMAKDFEVTDQLVDFYSERALGGVGMIIVGYATVDDLSGMWTNIGAHDDKFIPGLARLAEAIKKNGARCGVQLNHAGRYNSSFFLNGREPVAPSAVPSRMTKETPRELTIEEIKEIIKGFAAAAARVKTAGFDAVEILNGTGYLISQFLSPLTNRRTDEYGGDFESRMRFGIEVFQNVRKAVGSDFPVIIRMNGNEFMPGGLTHTELKRYAKRISKEGVDAICVNVGWHEAKIPQIVSEVPVGVFSYLAMGIKEVVDVPVIASHRINRPDIAREMIADGMCDMVAMGRSLIADPYLPEKARTARDNEIVHCIGCAQGCFDNIFKLKPVECLCNPRAGREKQTIAIKSEKPKKIIVIGGGPAGMSAAISATDRGHNVTLYEKSGRLGGQLHLAAMPPGRSEFAVLAQDLANQLTIRKIRVVLNQTVDEALLEKEKPEAVILATGAIPIMPQIKGTDLPHVVQAWDVLDGKVRTGRRVAIIGGGAVGVETALFLAEKGRLSADALKFLFINKAEEPGDLYRLATRGIKNIVLIEMIDKIGSDIGKTTRWSMLQELARGEVEIKPATKALEITNDGLKVESNGKIEEIPADTVVLGVGARQYYPLKDTLDKMGIPYKIIGDALKVGRAFDAIHQGWSVNSDQWSVISGQ